MENNITSVILLVMPQSGLVGPTNPRVPKLDALDRQRPIVAPQAGLPNPDWRTMEDSLISVILLVMPQSGLLGPANPMEPKLDSQANPRQTVGGLALGPRLPTPTAPGRSPAPGHIKQFKF